MSAAQPVAMSGAPPRRIRVGRLDLLGLAAFTLIAVALGMGLLYAPTELIQGEPNASSTSTFPWPSPPISPFSSSP